MTDLNSTYIQSPFNKQRQDKFLLVLNLPPSIRKTDSKFERRDEKVSFDSIQFSVFSAAIPAINIPKVDTLYGGQTYAQSSLTRPAWDPVSVGFTVDNRFNNYWTIYSWLNFLNDDATGLYDKNNLTGKFFNPTDRAKKPIVDIDYTADLSLFSLDEYYKRTVEFIFKKAFPISLGALDLNYRTSNELETSFTFAYSQFYVRLVENVDSL